MTRNTLPVSGQAMAPIDAQFTECVTTGGIEPGQINWADGSEAPFFVPDYRSMPAPRRAGIWDVAADRLRAVSGAGSAALDHMAAASRFLTGRLGVGAAYAKLVWGRVIADVSPALSRAFPGALNRFLVIGAATAALVGAWLLPGSKAMSGLPGIQPAAWLSSNSDGIDGSVQMSVNASGHLIVQAGETRHWPEWRDAIDLLAARARDTGHRLEVEKLCVGNGAAGCPAAMFATLSLKSRTPEVASQP